VALDLFPAFYALARGRQRARDYAIEYEAGRLSHTARRLMDALVREHPQYTRELRGNAFMLESSRTREFERAMAELQQGLWVVKTEERYEPTFSYRWDLVEAWLPQAVKIARGLSRAAALDRLVSRYLTAAVYSRPHVPAREGMPAAGSSDDVAREPTPAVPAQGSGRLQEPPPPPVHSPRDPLYRDWR
jgi:hypothetical protein